ncbi:MAG: DUF1553 domain-containing protein [Planctomycetota bacterium]
MNRPDQVRHPFAAPHFVASIVLGLAVVLLLCSQVDAQKIDESFYRDQIKPILSNKCYTCHGPDENTREGGFRFDVKESAFGEADSGLRPIVAGDLDASELLKRIHATDESKMPPADQQRQLTDQEKSSLKKWIEAGSPWQQHWAFIPIKDAARPGLSPADATWCNNPIDEFVLARLKENGMVPSGRASKATLIRRLTLDMTGLPPTIAEVDQFLADQRDDAYERLVDRLLASPHYGEQLASSWLDAARFADSNGYQNDFSRTMWPWRDWVIRAFNENMPFDQFTIEQLAGDMLPKATEQQKVASGFNRNNRSVTEGGSIEAEWHVENVVDRLETTSTVFLGLTMGCARCHDHKFDPVSQREFYEFYAFFNSSKDKGVYNEKRGNFGPMLNVRTAADQARIDQFDSQIKVVKTKIEQQAEASAKRQKDWETTFNASKSELPTDDLVRLFNHPNDTEAITAKPKSLEEKLGSQKPRLQTVDAPFLIDGQPVVAAKLDGRKKKTELGQHMVFDGAKPFSLSVWVKPNKFGAVLSRMDQPNAYRGFDLILLDDGRVNVHLISTWPRNAIKVTSKSSVKPDQWSNLLVTYDGQQKAAGLKLFADGQPLDLEVNNDNLSETTLTDHPLWLGQRTHTPGYVGLISDVRFFDRAVDQSEAAVLFESNVRSVTQVALEQRSEAQNRLVRQKFRSLFSPVESVLQQQLAVLKKERESFLKSLPTTMVMEELETPRETYLLNRGQYDQPDKSAQLQPGIPKFLPPLSSELPSNRLGLAKWLVSPDNPLTARVTVNRFWQNIFGAGLVPTPENFGVQSPTPTHPELLDWLAYDFVTNGWDVKRFHKMVVMSATYQQSSTTSDAQVEQDAENRWLGRGARFRLPAESIRDNALAISGLLSPQIGGRSIKPYQPAGVWKELAGGAGEKPYVQEKDENLYRRSMYIYRKRTVPHPTMSTFDAGSREICQIARQRTNTPLQALALLNDPTYVESARVMATKCVQQTNEMDAQIQLAFRRATSRPPTDEELNVLRAAVDRYEKAFAAMAADQVDAFLDVGEAAVPEGIDKQKLAVMTVLCSTILNLDETVTRE